MIAPLQRRLHQQTRSQRPTASERRTKRTLPEGDPQIPKTGDVIVVTVGRASAELFDRQAGARCPGRSHHCWQHRPVLLERHDSEVYMPGAHRAEREQGPVNFCGGGLGAWMGLRCCRGTLKQRVGCDDSDDKRLSDGRPSVARMTGLGLRYRSFYFAHRWRKSGRLRLERVAGPTTAMRSSSSVVAADDDDQAKYSRDAETVPDEYRLITSTERSSSVRGTDHNDSDTIRRPLCCRRGWPSRAKTGRFRFINDGLSRGQRRTPPGADRRAHEAGPEFW